MDLCDHNDTAHFHIPVGRPEPNMLIFWPIILFRNSHKLFLLFFLSYLLFSKILVNFQLKFNDHRHQVRNLVQGICNWSISVLV